MDPGRTTPAEPACAAGAGSVDVMVETFMAEAEIPPFFFVGSLLSLMFS